MCFKGYGFKLVFVMSLLATTPLFAPVDGDDGPKSPTIASKAQLLTDAPPELQALIQGPYIKAGPFTEEEEMLEALTQGLYSTDEPEPQGLLDSLFISTEGVLPAVPKGIADMAIQVSKKASYLVSQALEGVQGVITHQRKKAEYRTLDIETDKGIGTTDHGEFVMVTDIHSQ